MRKPLKIIGIVFVVFLLLGIVRGVFVSLMRGVSMAPTYNDGDVLLINKFSNQFSRGDVVVFRRPATERNYGHMIKRIVGLPSEKIEIRDGNVFVNGAELREDYHQGETSPNLTVALADDQYFILGDNRPSSADSRSFGPITRSNITAKVSKVLYRR